MNYEKKEREFLEGGKDGEGDAVGVWERQREETETGRHSATVTEKTDR